jgi:hypothetical protein
VLSARYEEQPINKTKYLESYYHDLSKNSSRFRLTKGEFTDYLEKNYKTNKFFGPLIGQERSKDKSEETKKAIRENSLKSL